MSPINIFKAFETSFLSPGCPLQNFYWLPDWL